MKAGLRSQNSGVRSNPRAGAREDSGEQIALGRVSLPAPESWLLNPESSLSG